MNQFKLPRLVFSLLLGLGLVAPQLQAQDGWQELFNGKNLEGWTSAVVLRASCSRTLRTNKTATPKAMTEQISCGIQLKQAMPVNYDAN